MVRVLLVALVALVLPLALVPAVSARALDEQIASKALRGTVHARVVLPAGYASSGERYPVVYFLHGLPAGPDAYDQSRWLGRTLRQLHRAAILVEPQGARDGDSDPEYLDWGSGRDWETYVAQELPRWVDAHFRTIPTRAGRAIVGLSAGGYGASLVGFDHPGRFAVVESWSGYFHPTDPTGHRPLDRGSEAKNAQADVHLLVAADARARTLPAFFGFYVGSRDTRFRAENARLNRELNAERVPHAFTVYPGGHTTALWQAHAAEWLRMALNHLAGAR
ncbi:MAG TPA: alpha/beta hydrolase-fold protein [Gaiellaceae bacterium]|jgi:S-formylglutathione hydrolase FrmB